MKALRRWKLSRNDPYALQLAADARLSRTDYTDDQVWEVRLGSVDEPAITLESGYGGRIKSVQLIPAVLLDNRLIYLTQAFSKPPVVTAFAPGYVRLEAALTPDVGLRFEVWVMESQAVGGPHRMPLANLPLAGDTWGLSMGRLPGFEPVLLLEYGQPDVRKQRKPEHFIATERTLVAGERVSVRWCHAGLDTRSNSANRAQYWLDQDWEEALNAVARLGTAIPDVETGDEATDAVIAFSGMQLTQAFLRATAHLRGPSLVATRQPGKGFSRRGDGSDQGRGWDGQDPYLSYNAALTMASIHPAFAQSLVENFLSVQSDDGSIDMSPGLAGQRAGLICPPILAQMAWRIYEATLDQDFVSHVYPQLLGFFNRWFETDLDADFDLLPEWQDVRQTGYIFWPTFASAQPWSVGMNIARVESPDLAAYLLAEADALRQMAALLDDPGAFELSGRMKTLMRQLDQMWLDEANRYAYQERDTGVTTDGVMLVANAPAHEEAIVAYEFDIPGRVIVCIVGGAGNIPNAMLYIDGIDAQGNTVQETVPFSEFQWGYGLGTFTTRQMYQTVNRVRTDGLSRVFKMSVFTADLTRADINGYLPLIITELAEERKVALVSGLNSDRFVRPSGLTIVAADDPNFDPSSAEGGGGTWTYWTTRICEALVAAGEFEFASELLRRLLRVQVETLRMNKQFSEFYHSDEPRGLGEPGHIGGLFPVATFLRVIGVSVIDSGRVYAGGPFAWNEPVTVRQHGVEIRRSQNGTHITFPSGHKVTLDADAPWQLVIDPNADETPAQDVIQFMPPENSSPASSKRVIIDVSVEDDPEGS
jgi:hypothetical protein